MLAPDVRTVALLVTVAAIAIFAAGASLARGEGSTTADPRHARLARVATALSAAVWVLLVFGSSVRVNGAGLACPDWPACFGDIVPQLDWEVSLEFGHRVYAGVVSLVFVGLGVVVARERSLRSRMWPWFAAAAVALAVQIVLGGLTVLHLLAEWTVASHLVVGNTFSALIALVALELRDVAWRPVRVAAPAWLRPLAGALLVVVLAQLALGGLVASSHAGLACGTWPGCNGSVWFPTFEGLVGLQVMHRITAYALLAVALACGVAARGLGPIGRAGALVAAVAVLQATIGVANVLLHLPVEVTLLHSAGAGALVLSTTWLNHAVWRAPVAVSVAAPSLVEAR